MLIIDWNKYFSHIFVISGCSNFERRNWMNQELSRINLSNFKYWYNFNDNQLLDYSKNTYLIEKHQRVRYAHYSLIKTCYQLGYDNILIMEDDICFLNDLGKIKEQLEIFNKLKNDVDIYLFDYYNHNNLEYYYADCYYLNRKGMKYLIYMLENFPLNIDQYFYTALLNGQFCDKVFGFFDLDENSSIEIKIDDLSILPILLQVSPEHLCIQRFECDIPYDFLDEFLYNKI